MNVQFSEFLSKYPEEIGLLFEMLRDIILKSTDITIEEKLWAKLPSFYVGEKFVRVIPFKDHINIEASAVTEYREKLEGYKITPKGMLQIYLGQEIPEQNLSLVFSQTLN